MHSAIQALLNMSYQRLIQIKELLESKKPIQQEISALLASTHYEDYHEEKSNACFDLLDECMKNKLSKADIENAVYFTEEREIEKILFPLGVLILDEMQNKFSEIASQAQQKLPCFVDDLFLILNRMLPSEMESLNSLYDKIEILEKIATTTTGAGKHACALTNLKSAIIIKKTENPDSLPMTALHIKTADALLDEDQKKSALLASEEPLFKETKIDLEEKQAQQDSTQVTTILESILAAQKKWRVCLNACDDLERALKSQWSIYIPYVTNYQASLNTLESKLKLIYEFKHILLGELPCHEKLIRFVEQVNANRDRLDTTGQMSGQVGRFFFYYPEKDFLATISAMSVASMTHENVKLSS
jgi:hypothetical protein